MVFCLLPKKSGETYTTAFNIIKDKMKSLGMSIEIQTFRSDFKTAAYSSMRSLFPGLVVECCSIIACFSRLVQMTWTKFRHHGLSDHGQPRL